MTTWILPLLLVAAASDPRIPIVRSMHQGSYEVALDQTRRLAAAEPELVSSAGLHYLRGHLLEQLGEVEAASEAFAESLSTTPQLVPWAKYRLARTQERLHHPEVAAGIAATLLGSSPPRSLISPTTRLLVETLRMGGDCRLLSGRVGEGLPASERRLIDLTRAQCLVRESRDAEASQLFLRLMQERSGDLVAFEAAQELQLLIPEPTEPYQVLLLGSTLHEHRIFDRSAQLLGRAVVGLSTTNSRSFQVQYQWIRSHFWLGRFDVAARHYADLAARTTSARQTSQALYQRARSLELGGNWADAGQAFRRAYEAQPTGNYGDSSLLGAMRLDWRAGQEEGALELYSVLSQERSTWETAARAALFLASSDLAQGRIDRAGTWLADADRFSRSVALEQAYWLGRLRALEGDLGGAVTSLLKVVKKDPFHPLARLALEQLHSVPLSAEATRRAQGALSEGTREALHTATLLFRPDDRRIETARTRLIQLLRRDDVAKVYIDLVEAPVEDWPLWQRPTSSAQGLLLRIGIWDEAADVVTQHFPVEAPALALAAAAALERSGKPRRGLLIAEILSQRVPSRIPAHLQPESLRRVLHPPAFQELIERAAHRHDIDPRLLAAIIREESRFEAEAASNASARGLTQFVYPTASRIAKSIKLDLVGPRDLERPEIAIELGAAYLGELSRRFGGATRQMVTAYNAGEPVADLWQRYCFTRNADEYITKAAFRETRNYIVRVLSSYAQYTELYGAPETGSVGAPAP